MRWKMYSKKVMNLFLHPKNMGDMKDADGVGKVGNPICGDVMWIFIKVKNIKNKLIIKDIKFKTLGCAAAIATSSKVTELAKGKTISEALKISKKDVADALGGLPAVKFHCSLLATDGLSEAIYNYFKKNKIAITETLEKTHQRILKEFSEIEKRKH